jgi:hypothetical protein
MKVVVALTTFIATTIGKNTFFVVLFRVQWQRRTSKDVPPCTTYRYLITLRNKL